jgi:hypothetical protein
MEEYVSSEHDARVETSCLALEQELITTMKHGERRGVGVDETFEHFDPQGEGFVNAQKVYEGFGKLGIGAVMGVAEKLVEKIGGVGSRFFTADQLDTYYQGAEVLEVADGENIDWSGYSKQLRKAARAKQRAQEGDSGLDRQASSRNVRQLEDVGDSASIGSSLGSKGGSLRGDSMSILSGSGGGVGAPVSPVKDIRQITLPVKKSQPKKASKKRVSLKDMMAGIAPKPGSDDSDDDKNNNALTLTSSAATTQPAPGARSSRPASKSARRKKQASAFLDAAPAPKQQQQQQQQQQLGSGNSVRGSPGRVGARKKNVDLVGVHHELTQESVLPPESVLHVDNGVMMTYRVTYGNEAKDQYRKVNLRRERQAEADRMVDTSKQRRMAARALRKKNQADMKSTKVGRQDDDESQTAGASVEDSSTQPNRADDADATKVDQGPLIDRSHGFTLVAVPDLFMTLETMEKSLSPLKTKYPDAAIVYVGLPGLPNTHWPRGWILNADLHARCIGVLMQFLLDTEKVSTDPKHPVLLFGFGSGACCLSRFCAAFLPAMQPLYRRVRLVSMVSGFINPGQGFKRVCTELKEALMTANEAQMHKLVSRLPLVLSLVQPSKHSYILTL